MKSVQEVVFFITSSNFAVYIFILGFMQAIVFPFTASNILSKISINFVFDAHHQYAFQTINYLFVSLLSGLSSLIIHFFQPLFSNRICILAPFLPQNSCLKTTGISGEKQLFKITHPQIVLR